jgi:hypothetical protein
LGRLFKEKNQKETGKEAADAGETGDAAFAGLGGGLGEDLPRLGPYWYVTRGSSGLKLMAHGRFTHSKLSAQIE